ncbi:C2 domain-containing protein [Gautieria morchelliformis]|nr:C2 domain-containing protein [Gautieria morchelliformis]
MTSRQKLGTLVVVVLKARNLTDSHTFYKQDPYALVRLGGTEKKTGVDVRGGQHPVWDDELHLPVLEFVRGSDGRTLNVAAYSKEPRVDELIGEGQVDISDTLVNGEFDDWVKLQLNGAYRGEIYLEMTPSKLSPNDRLLRPPATPPKEATSPHVSPQRSPQLRASLNTNASPRIQPPSSPRLLSSSPRLYPAVSSASSSPRRGETHLPTVPRPGSTAPRQPYVDPTLKNIPFLDVGPAYNPAPPPAPAPAPAPALYSVPSILRPRNVKSSPIPVPARDSLPPAPPPKDDPSRRFQRELAESDAEFAARLAESEGIDVARLKAEESDAELARRLASEEQGDMGGGTSISGTDVGRRRVEVSDAELARRLAGEEHAGMGGGTSQSFPGGWVESD